MPVLLIECPNCGHRYRSLVVEGTKTPQKWACSGCGGESARPLGELEGSGHPWASECMDGCCG